MNANDLPYPPSETDSIRAESLRMKAAAQEPELGDVVDSIDDAAAKMKTVVRNVVREKTDLMFGDARSLIRDQPLAAMAIVGAVAYLVGRLGR
jgi:ElaB/YqjD/DUF883 family membrane-anchored ribosome-binding protein